MRTQVLDASEYNMSNSMQSAGTRVPETDIANAPPGVLQSLTVHLAATLAGMVGLLAMLTVWVELPAPPLVRFVAALALGGGMLLAAHLLAVRGGPTISRRLAR